jgi:predicted lipoprotein
MCGALEGLVIKKNGRARSCMKAALVIAAALTLSACHGTTKNATGQPKNIAPFQVGKTTYDDVVPTLGEPAGSTHALTAAAP